MNPTPNGHGVRVSKPPTRRQLAQSLGGSILPAVNTTIRNLDALKADLDEQRTRLEAVEQREKDWQAQSRWTRLLWLLRLPK